MGDIENLPSQTLAEAAYQRLRADIIAGRLAGSAKLRIAQLSERYGLGASPLREALNRLVSEGLVLAVGQRGFYVPPLTAAELRDLTETRILIETAALRRSIAHGDDAWEATIVAAFHRLSKVEGSKPIDIERRESLNHAFHAALLAACPLKTLLQLHQIVYDRHQRYRSLSLQIDDRDRDLQAEHAAIKDAALSRDSGGAAKAIRIHIQRTADSMLSALEQRRPD